MAAAGGTGLTQDTGACHQTSVVRQGLVQL